MHNHSSLHNNSQNYATVWWCPWMAFLTSVAFDNDIWHKNMFEISSVENGKEDGSQLFKDKDTPERK